MKLLDVAEFYSDHGGGVKTYIQQKLQVSHHLGVKTVIVAPGTEDRREQREHGTIIWLKSPPIPVDRRYHFFNNYRAIHEVLNSEKPQIVEGSSPWLGGRAVSRWQGDAVKSFFIHQDPVSSYPQLLLENILKPQHVDWLFAWFWRYMRRLGDTFDTTVVSAPWFADRLAGLGLRRPTPIPFGIEKGLFSPALRNENLRRHLLEQCGIDDPDARLILSVSRHHPEKRIGTMIDAVAQVNKSRPVGLYLIGDGPRRKAVEKHARSVKGVHVAGQVRDRHRLAKILASSDAMIHCCASETFGLVIAEALSSGLPLIVPDRGGAFDLADKGYAEVHKVGDARSCADAIVRLFERNQAQLRASAARANVRTSADHYEHLFNHYAGLMNASGRELQAA